MQIGRDFPGCPVLTWLPSNTGDVSSIPGPGTKIRHSESCSVVSDSLHHYEQSKVNLYLIDWQ